MSAPDNGSVTNVRGLAPDSGIFAEITEKTALLTKRMPERFRRKHMAVASVKD